MGKPSSNTTTNVSQPPAQVLQNYTQLTGQAKDIASQPLQQYSGPMIAGFTPQQQAAFNTVNNSQGIADPYINAAAQLEGAASTPISPTQFSPAQVQQYMSPYIQNVIQPTEAEFSNMNQQQQQQVIGNAITHGAWGGDRSAIAQAETAHQQALAQDPIIANLFNQGYGQALGEFNTQQQVGVGAQEASGWLASNAGYGLGNLGQEAQSTALTGAASQLSAGDLQQQLAQEQLNIPYEQFIQQQAYPFQTASWLSSLETGLGGASGGTSSTTSPGPSTGSQVVGGLESLAGLGGLLFGNRGGRMMSRRAMGGRLGYDGGGGLPTVPSPSMANYITAPNFNSSRFGPPAPPAPASAVPHSQQDSGAIALNAAIGKLLGHKDQSMTDWEQNSGMYSGPLDPGAGNYAYMAPSEMAAATSNARGGRLHLATGGTGGAVSPAMSPFITGFQASPGRGIPIPQIAPPSSSFAPVDSAGNVVMTPMSNWSPPNPAGQPAPFITPLKFPYVPAATTGTGTGAGGSGGNQQGGQGGDQGTPGGQWQSPFSDSGREHAHGGRLHFDEGGAAHGNDLAPMPPQMTPHPMPPQVHPMLGVQPMQGAPRGIMPYTPGQGGSDGGRGIGDGNPSGGQMGAAGQQGTFGKEAADALTGLALGGVGLIGGGTIGSMAAHGYLGDAFGAANLHNADINPSAYGIDSSGYSAADFGGNAGGYGGGATDAGGGYGSDQGGHAGQGSATGGEWAGGRIHRDLGGGLMMAPPSSGAPVGGGNPLAQGMYQRFSQLPMEKLQELAVRVPPTSGQGQIIQRALQSRRMNPTAGMQAQPLANAPQAPGAPAIQPFMGAPQAPLAPGQQPNGAMTPPPGQPQPMMAEGGRVGYDEGGDVRDPLPVDPTSGLPLPRMPSETGGMDWVGKGARAIGNWIGNVYNPPNQPPTQLPSYLRTPSQTPDAVPMGPANERESMRAGNATRPDMLPVPSSERDRSNVAPVQGREHPDVAPPPATITAPPGSTTSVTAGPDGAPRVTNNRQQAQRPLAMQPLLPAGAWLAQPTALNPNGGVSATPQPQPTPTPQAQPAPQRRNTNWASIPWAALFATGAATLAGTSPHAGVNIGRGFEAGSKYVEQQQAAETKQQEIEDMKAWRQAETDARNRGYDIEAKHFQQLADESAAHLKETTRHNIADESNTAAQRKIEQQRLALEATPAEVRTAKWYAGATPEQRQAYDATRMYHTTGNSPAKTAEWMVSQGLAKDINEAWQSIRNGVTPLQRSHLVNQFENTLQRDVQWSDPAKRHAEAERQADAELANRGVEQGGSQQGAVQLPPAAVSQLKEGQITTFGNGQKWTLKNGKPEQVP